MSATPAFKRVLWAVGGLVWLGGTAAGLASMASFANSPGVAAHAPARWPEDTRLTRDTAAPTLVMLAHPRCDCTRASLSELGELMARTSRPLKAFVVFIQPKDLGDDWTETSVWRDASRIPNVTVLRDVDGTETSRFGAETSGETLLYDRDGRLVYSGGTTGARGHVGDNAGFEALLGRLTGVTTEETSGSVFGCALFAPQDRPRGAGAVPHGS